MSQVPVDPGSHEEGDCDEVRRHLWPYLDEKADRPTCAELEAHLRGCDHCRRMAEFDRRFKQLVRRCADEPVSQTVVETLRIKVEAVSRLAVEASKIEGTPRPRQQRARVGCEVLGFARWPVLLMWCLIYALRYSSALAERLVRRAVALLPESTREHYEAEWLAELDWLKQQRRPLLGWAVGVVGSAVFTRLELRARLAGVTANLREIPRSPLARVVGRYKPLWLGVLTAASVFCAAAVGWSGLGQHGPTAAQLVWAGLASVFAGGGVTWQAWPRGPVGGQPPTASGDPERTDAPQ